MIAPQAQAEQAIARILCAALGVSRIDMASSIGDMELDPVIAEHVVRRIALHFGAAGSPTQDFSTIPIKQLAEKMGSAGADGVLAPSTTRELASFGRRWEDSEEHPLPPGMAGLWFLYRLSPESSEYITPHFLRIRAEVSPAVLRAAFQHLVDRHSSLRTVYGHRDGVPYFKVLPAHDVNLHVHDVSQCDDSQLNAQLAAAAARPFDLSSAPPFAAHLFTRGKDDHVFLLAGHHILWDYASLVTVMREFNAIYAELAAGRPVPDLGPADDLRDFVAWHKHFMDREGERQWSYWRRELEGAAPFIDLPTTGKRPQTIAHKGGALRFNIGGELLAPLLAIAKHADTTLHAVLISTLQLLLVRYSNQRAFCITSLMSGRARPELQNVVGYLVNPVIIRGDLAGNPSFLDVLKQTARATRYAFAYQYFPFALTVERLRKARDPGRSPFQQVVFVLQQSEGTERQGLAAMAVGEETATMDFGGLPAEVMYFEDAHAQFDLAFMMTRVNDTLGGVLQYSADLFSSDFIRAMVADLILTLEWIVDDPHQRLSQLWLPGAARNALARSARRMADAKL